MFILQSDRLRVEIAEPEKVQKLTSRFDSTCFITEVVLDDSIHFAASEPHNMGVPSSGGRGLCSEFRFDALGEVPMGAWAPKLGVGLLKKDEDDKFIHYKEYEKETFRYELLNVQDAAISFKTLSKECFGYAAETTRTAWLEGNSLYMKIQLKNVGKKEITFREYCHNFISIDGMALGADYKLELPNALNLKKNVLLGPDFDGMGSADLYKVSEHAIRPGFYNPGAAVFDFKDDDIDKETPFRWRLSHAGAKASVTGTEYFRPAEVCVWSYDHMLCPEVNFKATVKPGGEVFWKRQWTFEQEEVK